MSKRLLPGSKNTKKVWDVSVGIITKTFLIGKILESLGSKIFPNRREGKNSIDKDCAQISNKKSVSSKIKEEFWGATKTLLEIIKTATEIYGVLLFIITLGTLFSQTPILLGLSVGAIVTAYSGIFLGRFVLDKIQNRKRVDGKPKTSSTPVVAPVVSAEQVMSEGQKIDESNSMSVNGEQKTPSTLGIAPAVSEDDIVVDQDAKVSPKPPKSLLKSILHSIKSLNKTTVASNVNNNDSSESYSKSHNNAENLLSKVKYSPDSQQNLQIPPTLPDSAKNLPKNMTHVPGKNLQTPIGQISETNTKERGNN